ncbi:peroxisomal membrane protein 4 [Zychaea mexicana]|uniref:peroxisomal membrane protein 4 n=1 Tax=Zychaea mexicana TaxID=64656 RepID=UPI0022FDB4E4|nr:peroxisomal membrane protein 4 [Zychaea mexicana]KAI9489227.1 peroxisomal membrane protein 4 [Zychaea mexicana]
MDVLEAIALNPKYHDVLTILKGFRNGIVYGTRIRFPHALVMAFLFKSGTTMDKFRYVFRATKQHAQNLGTFATIYKVAMFVQKKLNGNKQADIHTFVAGLLGGYFVFGENNAINQQWTKRKRDWPKIVLYIFARVAIALVKVPVKRQVIDAPQHTYPVFAAVSWGLVMYLFHRDEDTLQPSLRASMQYIYRDSDSWDSLRTLIWHNK